MKGILYWDSKAGVREEPDHLAEEEPLEIQVETKAVSVTMRTPGHDDELALGFLLTEGLIRRREDVQSVVPYWRNKAGNVIGIFLGPEVNVDLQRLTRHVFASSSCGLCGKATIDSVHQHFGPVSSDLNIEPKRLLAMAGQLRRAQPLFEETGGLHAAGVFTADGEPIVIREDVGRHNAVDKVLGYGFLHGLLPFDRHLLIVSGRASFEIVQKALAARIPVVAAVSAPSSLAVDFAEQSGQTLIGFLRQHRMNIYSHPERITLVAKRTASRACSGVKA